MVVDTEQQLYALLSTGAGTEINDNELRVQAAVVQGLHLRDQKKPGFSVPSDASASTERTNKDGIAQGGKLQTSKQKGVEQVTRGLCSC